MNDKKIIVVGRQDGFTLTRLEKQLWDIFRFKKGNKHGHIHRARTNRQN